MYSANIASQNSIKSPTPNKSTLVENRGVGDCRSTILLAEMHPFYTVSVGVMVLQALPNIFVTLHTYTLYTYSPFNEASTNAVST